MIMLCGIFVGNVTMDSHISHTTAVKDTSDSIAVILVTKVSVVSQISDSTLVYTSNSMPTILVGNVTMDSHISHTIAVKNTLDYISVIQRLL